MNLSPTTCKFYWNEVEVVSWAIVSHMSYGDMQINHFEHIVSAYISIAQHTESDHEGL